MRKIFWLSVTMLLLSLTVSAQQKKVAVLDPICRDGSVNNTFKLIVRGQMENVVTLMKEYQAYDRAAFDKIMEEQNFQRSGAVSDSDIKELGMMAGVDYIVVPEVSASDGYLSVLAKILDIETGQYNKAENEVMKMEPPIVKEVCSNMAYQLFSNARLKPSKVEKSELQLSNGRYVGEVLNGQPHGKGIMYFKSDEKNARVSYEGDWVNGSRSGKGIMIWKDGDKYDGGWKDNYRSGEGTYYWADGRKYIGNWENGLKNGQGTFYWADGTKYEGNWKNDHRNGNGIIYYMSGESKGDRYEGNWKDGKKSGQGTYYYANGDKYVGNYENGQKSGQGTFYWINGNVDQGKWVDGKREGKFKRIDEDGKKLKATYRNGERVKDWH